MWTLLTRDPNVLHIISQDVRLDFTSKPPRVKTAVYQPCLSAAQTAIVNAACLWISPIFTTLNKDAFCFSFSGKAHATTISGFLMAMHKLLFFLQNSCGCPLAICGARAIYQ